MSDDESQPETVPTIAPASRLRDQWLPELLLIVAITLMGAGVDQWTKGWVVQRLGPLSKDSRGRMRPPADKPPVEVIDGWFRLHITGNQGAIFGLGRSLPERFKRPFFLGTALLAMVFILLLMAYSRPEQLPRRIGLALVLSGAVGNFIDRIRFDYVVDFLDWYGGYNWPTFNVADVWISIGLGLVLLDLWLHPEPRETEPVAAPEDLDGVEEPRTEAPPPPEDATGSERN